MKRWQIIENVLKFGGEHSGHHGHKGVPGQRGGSAPSSGGGQGPTDVEWAKGIKAAKDLGGQVPQKAVKEADKILQKASLVPSVRKAPKTYKDIGAFYETTQPVSGDIWEAKGITIEVGMIAKTGTGGTAIDIHIRTSKGGRTSTVYTNKDWVTGT